MIYSIENEKLKLCISDMGCTLVSLIEKSSNTDIVLGFENETGYLENKAPHFGAVVGRNANRIAKGKFNIGDNEYQVSINNGPNSLHSGVSDFSFIEFAVKEKKDDSITFYLHDEDMHGGFPGNLDVEVKYSLFGNEIIFEYSGICDKDSILNMTNHTYFTLNGGVKNILDHELMIDTDRFSLNDSDGMSTDVIENVDGTSFDFRQYKVISENFKLNHPNLAAGGLDHNFVYENLDDKHMASLRNDKLQLDIYSDLPDMHVYSACFLDGIKGKYNQTYDQYHGIALECDYYPNGLNYEGIIKPIVKANEKCSHYIKYVITKR